MSEQTEYLRTRPKEFGGVLGTLFLTLFLPLVVWIANRLIELEPKEYISYFSINNLQSEFEYVLQCIFNINGWLLYTAWLSWIVVCWSSLPCQVVEGLPLKNGSRLKYRLNAFQTFICTMAVFLARIIFRGKDSLNGFISNFYSMLVVSVLVSHLIAISVYGYSLLNKSEIVSENTRYNFIYDYFIGRPLNPRIGDFDIKQVIELRPGLMLWNIFVLLSCIEQYQKHNYISDSLILVTMFQLLFVLDACWLENAVLSTMDITTDGFGFMLSFGNLTWVPFLYPLQARYLAKNPMNLGLIPCCLIISLHFYGYYIFRSANNEKNTFRKNPSDSSVVHLGYIETKAGSKLLTTGWWGAARHINYLGDWLIGWSFCLPCGFKSPLPYFYMIYFTSLLLHREMRDELKCMKKYGDDWIKYKSIVRYKFIPGIY